MLKHNSFYEEDRVADFEEFLSTKNFEKCDEIIRDIRDRSPKDADTLQEELDAVDTRSEIAVE